MKCQYCCGDGAREYQSGKLKGRVFCSRCSRLVRNSNRDDLDETIDQTIARLGYLDKLDSRNADRVSRRKLQGF